jgi:sphingoid base N-palmitoyltransferase
MLMYVFQAAKATKYANYQRLCDGIFAVFTIIWFMSRLGVYPFYIIWRWVAESDI